MAVRSEAGAVSERMGFLVGARFARKRFEPQPSQKAQAAPRIAGAGEWVERGHGLWLVVGHGSLRMPVAADRAAGAALPRHFSVRQKAILLHHPRPVHPRVRYGDTE
jgi:hypothetical protein